MLVYIGCLAEYVFGVPYVLRLSVLYSQFKILIEHSKKQQVH
jgi:hypothetical protein